MWLAGAFWLRAPAAVRDGPPYLTMSAILKLSGVSKRFGSLVANDNLSMHLNEGEALRGRRAAERDGKPRSERDLYGTGGGCNLTAHFWKRAA